jgi:prepilin-type N-terminal cleavage/methylation domain-containing protein
MKMNKRGTTLVELIVAMGIFTIVSSLAISSFVTIMRMKELGTNMKNSQQKVRVALEQVTRLSRQADKVEVSPDHKMLKLYFLNGSTKSAVKFSFYSGNWSEVNNPTGTIYYYTCPSVVSNACSDSTGGWSQYNSGQDLFGGEGILKLSGTTANKFEIAATLPPTLDIFVNGKIPGGSNNYFFNDSMTIETKTIMENVK